MSFGYIKVFRHLSKISLLQNLLVSNSLNEINTNFINPATAPTLSTRRKLLNLAFSFSISALHGETVMCKSV